jgi:hypothetical protein
VKYKVVDARNPHVYEIELATLSDLLEFVFTRRAVLVRSCESPAKLLNEPSSIFLPSGSSTKQDSRGKRWLARLRRVGILRRALTAKLTAELETSRIKHQ